ncbi:MAG: SPOR domain-containing protein [Fidelibacterota bacterium]
MNVWFFFAFSVVFTGCSREESHSGVVDNYYRISVVPPTGVKDPTFSWEILRKPEKSRLRFFDLHIRSGGTEMTFQPDAPGDYELEMTVFNSQGKEVTGRTYRFVIGEPASETVAVPPPSPPETIQVAEVEEEIPLDTPKTEVAMAIPQDTQEVAEEEDIPEQPSRVEPEEPAEAAPPVRGRLIGRIEGKFTVQISSWRTLEDAQVQVNELRTMGFDAYVQEAPFQETEEVWYRVRVGSFSTYEAANQAAKDIKKATGLAAWVDHVRVDY